ncbi:MAG TPA: hypothetical protein VJA21_20530 [Verrucomicrobiae bacterium]
MLLTFRSFLRQITRQLPVLGLAAQLALTGCGQKTNDTPSTAADSPVPVAEPDQPVIGSPPSLAGTNEEPSIAYGLAEKLQNGPFAAANPALKETFARALIAYDIGDYDRAFTELNDLGNLSGLNADQVKAVKELLAKTVKAAPQLATSNALATAAAAPQPGTYALAADGEPPFSTADPSVKETFARAKAAFDLGNYSSALSELNDLVTNAQLNWQQKYAVQSLLDKTPRGP